MKASKEWWVGLMFFAGLVTLGFVTIYFSDLTFTRGKVIEVVFQSVRGLRQGDDVNLAGMRIGTVRRIEYLPHRNQVRVALWLREPLVLREGYAVAINDASLLGGLAVEIDPGPVDAEPVPADSEILGVPPVDMIRSFGNVVKQVDDRIGRILDDIQDLTRKLRTGEGSIGALLQDRTLYDTVLRVSKNIDKITDRLQRGEGTLGKLLTDDETITRVDSLLGQISDVTRDLREGDGTLARLLRDGKAMDDLEAILADTRTVARDAAREDGSLRRLLRDDEIYENVRDAASGMREFVDGLGAGNGALDLLVHDEELRDGIREIVATVREITKNLSDGEGSLGKMLTRNDLHDELMRAVRVLTGSIEDARESAPLNTFTAALFTAF